jgi:hypothetical protein
MAELKMSIGTKTHGDRPLTPVEVAIGIQELQKETGETLENIARRLAVDKSTCNMFLAILDLPKDWHDIWRFGKADESGRLPFSMASKIAPKFKKNLLSKNDLDLLKGAAMDPKIPARRDDIHNIITCISKNPGKTVAKCIEEIMNLVPERIPGFVFITDINPEFVIDLKTRSNETQKSVKEIIKEIFSRYFPVNSVEDLRIKEERYIQILFNEEGHNYLYNLAEKEKLPLKNVINYIFEKEGF